MPSELQIMDALDVDESPEGWESIDTSVEDDEYEPESGMTIVHSW